MADRDEQVGAPVPFIHGLTARQALATLLIALGFGLLGSMAELYLDWQTRRQEVQSSWQRMLALVQPSAAEAAFLLNDQLSMRVVAGLAADPAVVQVSLLDEQGAALASHQSADEPASHPWAQFLFGDLAGQQVELIHSARPVGRLIVRLAPEVLAQRFLQRAYYLAPMGLLRALAICALVVLVFYFTIIRPLVRLAHQVRGIDPANPGQTPLPLSREHEQNEIGVLIRSMNRLLAAFQQGLNQRDAAEAELKALTRELEDRVERRTQALAAANAQIEALNRQLSDENARMGAELDVSRQLQRMILPTPDEISDIPGLDVATFMEAANEVGGDYYDILRDEQGHTRITIGDVTGHGLESGVVMLMTQSAVRTLTSNAEEDVSKVLNVINRTLFRNIQRMGSDKHLTLALLDYQQVEGGGLLKIGGQHESIIVVRQQGKVELIDTLNLGFPIGMIDEVAQFLGETEIRLSPADTVVLYTDGVTEAANEAHQLYGLDRLCRVLVNHRSAPAEAIRQAVIADLMAHVGKQEIFDDITLVVLKQK
jgi:sigma-B regulation protein RsbU (phosphoserine phosphatase)